MEGSETHGGSRRDLATALYNCCHSPSFTASALSLLPAGPFPLPEPHWHSPHLLWDSSAGLCLRRCAPCMVEAPGEACPPASLGPLLSSFCRSGVSHVFILDALFSLPLIFQNSHFNLGFYLNMMKFQACSQLHPRFQGILVERIPLQLRK